MPKARTDISCMDALARQLRLNERAHAAAASSAEVGRTCSSCMDPVAADETALVARCCIDVTGRPLVYCRGCAKTGGFRDRLACPRPACGQAVPPVDYLKVVGDADAVVRAMKATQAQKIGAGRSCRARPCPGVDCGLPIVFFHIGELRGELEFAVCNHCSRVSCSECDGTLEQHAQPGFECEATSRAMIALVPNAKLCPGCQIGIERIDGCNTITCRCGLIFCWLCGVHLVAVTDPDAWNLAHSHFRAGGELEAASCVGRLYADARNDGLPPYTGLE